MSKFDDFFKFKYTSQIAQAPETLFKDFCLVVLDGQFLLLASQTQLIDATRLDPATVPPSEILGRPFAESTTFHLVRLEDGAHMDRVTYHNDFIHLQHNSGTSLYQDLLAVLTIRSQTIHLLRITRSGHLVEVRQVGPWCSEDDALAVRLSEVREREWQQQAAQREEERARHPRLSMTNAAAPPSSSAPAAQETLPPPPPNNTTPNNIEPIVEEDVSWVGSPLLHGIKQRLMTHLYKHAVSSASHGLSLREELSRFYSGFDSYRQLVVWKVQLLDGFHMLLDMGSQPPNPLTSPGSGPTHTQQHVLLYHLAESRVMGFWRSGSDQISRVCVNHADLLYTDSCDSPMWDRYKVAAVALAGRMGAERLTPLRKIVLPAVSQNLSSSPYLDPSMFCYDIKQVGLLIRPRTCTGANIRFLLRSQPDRVAFRLDPGPNDTLAAGGEQVKRALMHLFHPNQPFILAVLYHQTTRPSVLNIYFKA